MKRLLTAAVEVAVETAMVPVKVVLHSLVSLSLVTTTGQVTVDRSLTLYALVRLMMASTSIAL